MILAIDTSSAQGRMALIGARHAAEFGFPARDASWQLPDQYRRMTKGKEVSRVAVATGPGSFTGVRVGASFGLGIAIGLRVPLIAMPTLDIQAARTDEPVTGVSEAGRGRVYYQKPGGVPALGEPAQLPSEWPVAGWLRPETEAALIQAGLRILPEDQLRDFPLAVRIVLETAREVEYESLKLQYVQSFGTRT